MGKAGWKDSELKPFILAGDWTQVGRDTEALYSFQNKTAYDLWMFWFLI